MKNNLFRSVVFSAVLLLVVGCTPADQTARNIIAASNAVLVTAQAQYKTQCISAPSGRVCVAINTAGAAQNVALDALATYCQFTPQSPVAQACIPAKSALPALKAALANLQTITAYLKTLIQGG
jgi:hypothetical protein